MDREFANGAHSRKGGHLVLLSGGADSATVLAMAHKVATEQRENGMESPLFAFHCNYGQRTEDRELKCFSDLCDHFGIDLEKRYVVDIGFLKQIGGSSLTDEQIEVAQDGHAIVNKYVPTSYVPFRNGNLISIATAIACKNEIGTIWLGVVEEDSSGYPDCRIAFIDNMNIAINCGLPDGHDLILETPIITFNKDDIIKHGLQLGVPYDITWSCYRNNEMACGVCDSCRLRLRSFWKNGIHDPIPYEVSQIELHERYEKGEFPA